MKGHVSALALTLAIAAGLAGAGCSHKVTGTFLPNQRPVVRLTWAPIRPPQSDSLTADFYIYKMNWVGYDTDGRVVAFQYAIDPPTDANRETTWVRTVKNEETIYFRASHSDQVNSETSMGRDSSREFHNFVIRAVDDKGATSAPLSRAFYSWGVAPEVTILTPAPSGLIHPTVTPAFEITWTGIDYVDQYGLIPEKPVKYKYHLYPMSDVPTGPAGWISHPDSMRAKVAPAFAGWDSCGGDTTSVIYTNQTPQQDYLFVIVAIGRSGAYSPVFSTNKNMLQMFVGLAGKLGPTITIYNSFFYYTYMSGGFPPQLVDSWAVKLEVPADKPITFNWLAEPPQGSSIKRYRWVLDLENLEDETERTDQNDWYHWSPWMSTTATATIGPFTGIPRDSSQVEQHNFFIEAEDINGLMSLGWVWFKVVKPSFAESLLVVNDTRLTVDKLAANSADSLDRPRGAWPTAAELDTFLFARGGFRWRMTPPGTAGAPLGQQPLSRPGIFQGYPFDTFGTRAGHEDPTIPLSTLGKYRHVIWMVDAAGAQNQAASTDKFYPITTLRYMCRPNRQNTLSTWVQQGGLLWALGGGFADATNSDWDNKSNNVSLQTYSNLEPATNPDLKAGRFMYDLVHWRSTIKELPGVAGGVLQRVDLPSPFRNGYPPPPNYWPGTPLTGQRSIFSGLPLTLSQKSSATDPVSQWPTRGASSYPYGMNMEALCWFASEEPTENNIIELTGEPPTEYTALDTLYLIFARMNALPLDTDRGAGNAANVVMTYYHGPGPGLNTPGGDNAALIFTGFPIWGLKQADCQALVNFVLQTMWGQPYTPPGAFASAHAAGTTAARPTSIRRAAVPLRGPTVPQPKAVPGRSGMGKWLRAR